MNPEIDLRKLFRQPSAFLPLGLSLLALIVVVAHMATVGAAPEHDEGAAAHLWQLSIGTQILVMVFFGIRWLPKAPKTARSILALQTAALLAALAPVFFLHL
jgi:peptidoglycan/LPS O-acetylase OafA/YrhL